MVERRAGEAAAMFAVGAGALALAAALFAERVLLLSPCALCLVERWPYRVLVVCGGAALLLRGVPRRLALIAALLSLVAATGLGVLHWGVERHWWPSPLPQCQAPDLAGLSAAERLRAMPDRPVKSCEDPDYPIPGLPLSLVELSLAYALAATAIHATLLARSDRRA